MTDSVYLHLSPNIRIEEHSEQLMLISPDFEWTFKQPPPFLKKCIELLNSPGKTKSDLHDHCISSEEGLSSYFFFFLEELKKQAFVSFSIFEKNRLLVTLVPTKAGFSLKNGSLEPLLKGQSLQLSRFAYLHVRKRQFVLETPLFPAEILIEDPICLKVLQILREPTQVEVLSEKVKELSEESLRGFLSLLLSGSFLDIGEESPSLITWEFHDLLFHTRHRQGRHNAPTGGTFRFLAKILPLPAIRSFDPNSAIPLFRPDLDLLEKEDSSFTYVLENRKSIREHHSSFPITIEQLGEFLYRAARVKERRQCQYYEASHRPSPAGGGCHELELYPVIYQCQGIESGLYSYHPEAHALQRKETEDKKLEMLLQEAMSATKKNEFPQILIVIAARFARISWKYQSMAYATILKNTGALLQTMYLVATAMELAPCAVGCGGADLFAALAKTNYYEETSVGEFILGNKYKKKETFLCQNIQSGTNIGQRLPLKHGQMRNLRNSYSPILKKCSKNMESTHPVLN